MVMTLVAMAITGASIATAIVSGLISWNPVITETLSLLLAGAMSVIVAGAVALDG